MRSSRPRPGVACRPVTTKYTVTLLHETVVDPRRLEGFAIERELASETPDWTTPQRALNAIREGVRLTNPACPAIAPTVPP